MEQRKNRDNVLERVKKTKAKKERCTFFSDVDLRKKEQDGKQCVTKCWLLVAFCVNVHKKLSHLRCERNARGTLQDSLFV